MEPTQVTSGSHPMLKEFVKLQNNPRYRHKTQQIALEGFNLVSEALRAGLTPRAFFYTREYYEQEGLGWLAIYPQQVRHFILPQKLFKKITETETPQPVAAIFIFNRPVHKQELTNIPELALILNRLQDPGNMGTIIRTAAAAGVDALFYTPASTDPYGPKVLRATAGAIFYLWPEQTEDPLKLIRDLKERGVQVIATSAASAQAHYSAGYKDNCALIIGNEADGIDDELIAEADLEVSIPQLGPVESLNAAVAAAVIMYEIIRCRSS